MALPKLESQITVPTGGWTISVTDSGGTDTGITVAAGTYYVAGATSILTTLQTALNASVTLAATYTLSAIDQTATASGKVSLVGTGGGNVSVTWTDTGLRDALGFTGNLSGSATYLSPSATPHMWLPNVGRTNPLSPEPTTSSIQMGVTEYDYRASRSPSGAVVALTYNERFNESLIFTNVKANKMWLAHEDVTNESLQKFIDTVFDSGGAPIKYFPDRTDDGLEWEWRFAGLHFQPTPVVPNWTGDESLWSISYQLWKK